MIKEEKIKSGRDETGRHKLSEVLPLNVPYNIQIEPTTICNFKCEYCIHAINNLGNVLMDWDTFLRLESQLRGLSNEYKIINIIGYGEPLIHPQIGEMVKKLHDADLSNRIELTTNASLLNKKKADELINSGLTRLLISLQGLNAESYKKICGYMIDYDVFLNNIRYFYNNKKQCKLHIKIADTALEEDGKDKFYEMFEGICDDLFIEHIIPEFKEIDYTDKLVPSGTIEKTRYGYEYRPAQVCPQPFYQMFIAANGDVRPCCMYPAPITIGNINNNSLNKIWNGPEHKAFMCFMAKKMRNKNSICNYCIQPEQAIHPLDYLDDAAKEILRRIEQD